MRFTGGRRPLLAGAAMAVAITLAPVSAQQPLEKVDLDAIYKIKDKEHFADRETMALKPAHAKLDAYFNVDNGTGAIRGIYAQGNEGIVPIFEQWVKPFANLGMTTVTIRDTGGTDHQSFDAVGLPGFQFVQDEVEYGTRTHHSNMDVYERIQEADMRQNAVIVAAFVYNAANRDERLPRKPLPKPQAPARIATTPPAGW